MVSTGLEDKDTKDDVVGEHEYADKKGDKAKRNGTTVLETKDRRGICALVGRERQGYELIANCREQITSCYLGFKFLDSLFLASFLPSPCGCRVGQISVNVDSDPLRVQLSLNIVSLLPPRDATKSEFLVVANAGRCRGSWL